MKKIILILALVASMKNLSATDNGGRFGMGITQNADASAAKNFSDKADYLAFMRDGKGFPMAAGTLYPGLTQATYNKYLPIMQKAHNNAFRAQLTEINQLTNGQLARDFGFTSSVFSDEMCQTVFMSGAVVPMAVPQNEEVTWDAYDVNDMEPFAITRGFHKIGSSKAAEMGWGLNITGYETILIKSQYCNNNAGTDWIKNHLVATSLPSDEGEGNLEPKTKTPIVVPCTPAPIVVACPKKTPIVMNGTDVPAKTPIVMNGSSASTTTAGPGLDEYNF